MSSNGLESKTVNELKELAKDLGIKGISKYKKAELIEEIEKISPSYIEKDGVILRERISPKLSSKDEDVSDHMEQKKNRVEKKYINETKQEPMSSTAKKVVEDGKVEKKHWKKTTKVIQKKREKSLRK